ncbi:MAG: VanZ family protein [Nocardioidaceae bacterium]
MLDDDVWRYLPLGPLPTLIVGFVGLGLLLAVGARTSPGTRRLAAVLLGMTTLAILAVTLGGGDASFGRSVNLQPGAGIRAELDNVNHALGVVNILGNIVVFVPLGWLTAVLVLYAPSVGELRGLRRGALAGLVLSLTIEMSQYFLGRAADVDDVLLNTAGAVLGATIGAALSALRRRHLSAAANRETGLLRQAPSRSLPL